MQYLINNLINIKTKIKISFDYFKTFVNDLNVDIKFMF